jgi:hypothetical protein
LGKTTHFILAGVALFKALSYDHCKFLFEPSFLFFFQHKNLLILYDAIGTLADSVGHHLNKQVSQ